MDHKYEYNEWVPFEIFYTQDKSAKIEDRTLDLKTILLLNLLREFI